MAAAEDAAGLREYAERMATMSGFHAENSNDECATVLERRKT